MIYTPKRLQNLYLWQEKNLRIGRVLNLPSYSVRKKKFISSKEGRKFLSYRTKKITDLNGVAVWLVDGTTSPADSETSLTTMERVDSSIPTRSSLAPVPPLSLTVPSPNSGTPPIPFVMGLLPLGTLETI